MERPTKEQVDAVIAWARSNKPIRPGPRNGHITLADEVEALRAELEAAQGATAAAGFIIDDLRAELADLERRSLSALEQMTMDATAAIDTAAINANLAEGYAALREELSKAERNIEDALEARDKWCSIAHRQKAVLEAVADVGPKWREDNGVWTAADYDRQVANALRGDQ